MRWLLVAVVMALLAPASAAAQTTRNCGWSSEVSGSQVNAAYPDEAATYWTYIGPIPPGGHIEAKGRYPHARYLSFHTYDRQLSAIDALADVEITPDAGSTNPFVEGARRDGEARDYTVRFVNARDAGAPNTIYTENADGSKSTRAFAGGSLTLRIYEPDRGRDAKGGVPLPTLTAVTATGARLALPECAEPRAPDIGSRQAVAALGPALDLPPSDVTGRNPPVWRRHLNASNSTGVGNLDTPLTRDAFLPAFDAATRRGASGGLAENTHNKYIFTSFERTFGDVLVLRAKLPRTPRTLDGEPVMGGGDLRYVSFCSNVQTTSYLACRNDDGIPTDAAGFATVVVSPAASRPSTATEACGVAWLPTGPAQAVLIVRNMLPNPGFRQAIQNAERDREEQVLGDFYPRGTYFRSKAAAERALPCRAPATTALAGRGGPCDDRVAPRSRWVRPLRLRSGRLALRGRAADRGCSQAVAGVAVSVARRTGRLCRPVDRRGRLGPRRSCLRTRYVPAAGRGAFRLDLPRLAPGRYVAWSRATDAVGNVERKARARNLQRFTVR